MLNGEYMETKRKAHLRVPVFIWEKEVIENQAKKAGCSVAHYLRAIGQGYPIRSVVDYEKVRELAKINGDLGRLGGLLKMWLNTPNKKVDPNRIDIYSLMEDIDKRQKQMSKVMSEVVNGG